MDVFKIVIRIPKAQMDQMTKEITSQHDSFDCVQTGERMLEVNVKGVSKGAALIRLEEEGYLTLAETMVFGDSHNDLTMFAAAGHAVAMKNAEEEVKQAADEVLPYDNNEGVWRYWQNKKSK